MPRLKTHGFLDLPGVALVALVLIGICFSPLAANAAKPGIELTGAEQAYLARSQPFRMCVDPDWEPFERINEQGRHEGIAADLIHLISQRLGIQIELHPTTTWEESLEANKSGACQMLSFLNQTPEREEWLNFTEPIFHDPNIIITREEHPDIDDLKKGPRETIALPRGTMVEEYVRRSYPNLIVVPTESENQAVTLVSERKADMTVRSLIVAAHTIKKEGLFNLKIAGQVPELANKLRIGVLKDEKILRDILDKGAKTLTPQDQETIINKYVSIKAYRGIDYRLVGEIIAVAAVILLVTLFWMHKLRTVNRKLEQLSITDPLTGVFNRVKLDEVLPMEALRSPRSNDPFSIILVDIDHFKRVNDDHGHQVGDQVLKEVAHLLRDGTRATDVVGRWGGEEFLIICPHTGGEGARNLAEKLRQAMRDHPFPVIEHKTASFGVATFQTGDTKDDLVARADAALYAAKEGGRNRVQCG